ncbi:hypothetical protein HYW75_05345 [Candidatus Pacearchaeota archaeon]|nr:hypothetical protein [Candidatus Pacearchaeota archaeon]
MFLINCFLWIIYGILRVDWPIIIGNSLAFTIVLIETVLKIKYKVI